MTTTLHILCPGQGAQVVGMGKDFADSSPAARATFETADRVLGFDLSSVCFNGPDDRLNQTDVSQPAIFTASVASFRAAVEKGLVDPSAVTTYAGLSLGEYTALHLAGMFDFDVGLKLVRRRGELMQAAAVAKPSSMVAIIGADEVKVKELCEAAREGEILVPANFNAPGQIVVSGSVGACERVVKQAELAGLKAVALKVAGAFHSPFMQPAADQMAAELERVNFKVPTTTVYSNVTAQPHGDVSSIKALLVEQIVRPVRWSETMQTLVNAGEARYVELNPGRTLAGLAKRINRRLPVESLDTVAAVTGFK